jgi:hypothetical protein
MLFACKHPFAHLFVRGPEEVVSRDEDFETVVYKFTCSKCGKDLDTQYLRLLGGVEAFMQRGRDKLAFDKWLKRSGIADFENRLDNEKE